MKAAITRFLRDEEGATAIEYGIIAGLMAVILLAVFNSDAGVKGTLNAIFAHVKTVRSRRRGHPLTSPPGRGCPP